MDLIDRYLTAIRWNLPRAAKADDVIAELRDLIASRVEDREELLACARPTRKSARCSAISGTRSSSRRATARSNI